MKKHKYSQLLLLMLALSGCADHMEYPDGPNPDSGMEMSISGRIEQEYVTRADDNGFADGDAIGVYVVDFEGKAPSGLKSHGNHADNIKFVYSEEDANWKGSAKIYWTDEETPVDAYGYYPFAELVDDATKHLFNLVEHQDKVDAATGLSGYEASDFLWAKASGVQPGKTIELVHHHMMAGVQVTLVEGEGFGDDWDTLDKDVTIDNTVINTFIDLSSGKVSLNENAVASRIFPYNVGNDYRAVVAPQTIGAGLTLLTISVGTDSYMFTRDSDMKYSASKLHRFVIKVDKKPEGDFVFTLVSEEITPWENDTVGHSASTKAYTVIDCPTPGSLKSVVEEAGIVTENIEYLKLTGTMNQDDFNFFNNNFRGLLALNMKELRTKDIYLSDYLCGDQPGWGIHGDGSDVSWEETFDDALPCNMLSEWFDGGNEPSHAKRLSHITLPDNCKYIGVQALAYLPLTGTLTIPEGVKWIGGACLRGHESIRHHISHLIIPSSVEYIGGDAFNGCEFINEILLSDNIKYIGDHAFANCINTSGEARIPQSIKYLGDNAFAGTPLTGTVVFPAGMKKIPSAFAHSKISGIYIPEGAEEIAEGAFDGSELRGDVRLPNSIRKIGNNAFSSTKINHINIPASLEMIPMYMLSNCIYLTDSIVIPENVRRINQGAFLNCRNLKYIRIPSSVEVIGGDYNDGAWGEDATFAGCYSLEELRCDAVEPPTLINDPFSGFDGQLHKDNFTLVVPEQSVALYQNAKWWSEFKRIAPYRNLVFRPQIAKVLNKGGHRDVVLNADAGKQWKVTECPDWLHISASSGVGKSTLSITIDEMPHGSANRTGEIKVMLEGTDYVTSFIATQFDYEYDEDQSFTLQEHTSGKNGVNLVIVGDGYDAEDISTGLYLEDMHKAAEMFFDLEPFKTYRSYFSVHTAFAMSYESGIGSVNYLRNSKFNTSYGNWNYDSRISCAADVVAYYCLDNTPVKEEDFGRLTCILVANGNAYDGVTTMYDNGTSVAICPKSDSAYPNDWRGLIQHEAAGHGFTKLADEYIYHNRSILGCPCTCCGHLSELMNMHAAGWGLNLATSAKNSDVHWSHMLKDNRVNDIVDIWEGGFFHSRGVFRSEYNSVMNHNVPYMSTWCRELAVRRIMDYAGETFDYEAFISKDSREWGRDFTLGSRASCAQEITQTALHDGAPIMVKGSPKRDFKRVRTQGHKH